MSKPRGRRRARVRRKPMEFWVVISNGKYPGALYVHWHDYSRTEVLEFASKDNPIVAKAAVNPGLKAIHVREVLPRTRRKR